MGNIRSFKRKVQKTQGTLPPGRPKKTDKMSQMALRLLMKLIGRCR